MRKEKIMRFFLAAVLAISMLAMPLTTAYAESVSSSSDAAPSSAVSSSTGTESFPDASSSSGAVSYTHLWNAKRGNGTFDALCASFCPCLLYTSGQRRMVRGVDAGVRLQQQRFAALLQQAYGPLKIRRCV